MKESRGASPPPGSGVVLVSGRPVLTAARVMATPPELSFPNLKRRKFTRQIFLHWTGGEGGVAAVHATLTAKKASVHFVVEPLGMAYQLCDADRLCGHAKGHNEESIGIEIVSRGDDAHVKDKLVKRRDVVEMVHGRHVRYGDFTDDQKVTVLALVETLCRAYHLPMQAPLGADGEVFANVLPASYLANFHGVLGHYHTRVDKRDPAPGLLELVQARGKERGLG